MLNWYFSQITQSHCAKNSKASWEVTTGETFHWLPKTRPLSSHSSPCSWGAVSRFLLGFTTSNACICATGGTVLARCLGSSPGKALKQ